MKYIYNDYPINGGSTFQDPASEWMYGIIELHDYIIFYLIILAFLVLWLFVSALFNKDKLLYLHHGDFIEVIWTITPAFILWAIGIPSLVLLYMMDEILDAEITVKAIGNQWYWSYEYTDYIDNDKMISFDSFLVGDEDLELGDLRQ
jgi:cytochrome c oxidase subunit 2